MPPPLLPAPPFASPAPHDADSVSSDERRAIILLREPGTCARKRRRLAAILFTRTRQTIIEALLKIFGKPPYDWQLDVAEAVLLGLDVTVLASTGSGKAISFILPLLADETGRKMVVIISPLKELQKDQVSGVHLNTRRASFTRARSPGLEKWACRLLHSTKTLGLRSYPGQVCVCVLAYAVLKLNPLGCSSAQVPSASARSGDGPSTPVLRCNAARTQICCRHLAIGRR